MNVVLLFVFIFSVFIQMPSPTGFSTVQTKDFDSSRTCSGHLLFEKNRDSKNKDSKQESCNNRFVESIINQVELFKTPQSSGKTSRKFYCFNQMETSFFIDEIMRPPIV